MSAYIPENYHCVLDVRETEMAIKQLKDFFERALASELSLTRVSAPLFVFPQSGLNDNLNGVERPVSFEVSGIGNQEVEIVHSLAKWKRLALYKYGFNNGEGIYTDMNAIRRDEELDNLHSIYVDQWDWEKIILQCNRKHETLASVVQAIFKVFRITENYIVTLYPQLPRFLPDDIFFITSQELLDLYPTLTTKEREDAICQKHKAVFISQIGGDLSNGKPHDGRAPDYDDWKLNGDILFWYPILNRAVEVSSMGIRVDRESLLEQLKKTDCEQRLQLDFHKRIIEKQLPYTMGGGLGQSRICMFFLAKAHLGEVQSAIWPVDMINDCEKGGIQLL